MLNCLLHDDSLDPLTPIIPDEVAPSTLYYKQAERQIIFDAAHKGAFNTET